MRVELINPEIVQNLFLNHGTFACTCYNTPEKFAEKVGKKCEDDGHMSGSRCEYIKFKVYDIDRGTAEQCLRHEIGTAIPFDLQDNYSFAEYTELVKDVSPDQIVKNMASFRYIDKDGFDYATPATIANCKQAKIEYDKLMKQINDSRKIIKEALVDFGVEEKASTQDANFVLPRATTTFFVIGFSPEAFIHFCHKRLCKRAQEFIREFAILAVDEVKKINAEFATNCVPHCRHLLWCPEKGMSCGAYPTRDELINMINAYKYYKKFMDKNPEVKEQFDAWRTNK